MAKKKAAKSKKASAKVTPAGKPSSLIDTRVIFCGDNLDQLKKFPDGSVDLIYIDPPFNSCNSRKIAEIAHKINSAGL